MHLKTLKIPLIALLLLVQFSYGKTSSLPADSVTLVYKNWYNKDPKTEAIYGIGTDRAYKEFLKDKPSQTVIVAVIDSGIDIHHEDLKPNIWINEGEIAGNGIDDDQNGYIDDVHGWNFLGNASGENIAFERLEVTRKYAQLKKEFEGKDETAIAQEEHEAFQKYIATEKQYHKELEETKETLDAIEHFGLNFYFADGLIVEQLGKENYSIEELKAFLPEDEGLLAAKAFLLAVHENGLTKEKFSAYKTRYENAIQYHLNPDYDPRPLIGDDPENMQEFQYGNNDVIGPDAEHGTHVAGVIAGVRDNGIGINGIATNVQIMALRAVPDGDERDKDIANAIRYAVNNGAQIINMSFGKNTSTHRKTVEEAIRLCEEKGVLLVHAAGNEGINVDEELRFPTNIYMDSGTQAPNFINVGATGRIADKSLVASFSNYGKQHVDIFAPGVDIYSSVPGDQYEVNSGTSMASPMVTGLAALLMSYYPSLDIYQIKEILYKSATLVKKKVYIPSSDEDTKKKKARLKSLSTSGGIINAYEAVKMAEAMTR